MSLPFKPPSLWKKILRTNFVDSARLAEFLELDEDQQQKIHKHPRFRLNLPMRLAQKIAKRTLDDPILKQFLPLAEENISSSSFIADPVGDNPSRIAEKLLHKYERRMLLVCSSACAMHCRYCFRQHFEYAGPSLFSNELKMIQEDPTVNEVILSGGDPLSLDDRVLEDLLKQLAAIPHIKKVRFHTRFPIGIPERLDESFLNLLDALPLQFLFVIHVNHPKELDADVLAALKRLQRIGVPILNQFVLLRGVNDQADVLTELCDLLVNHGILAYYMHQLDRVQGAAHFEVSEEEGIELIEELQKRLPGYAVPRYVKEISGRRSKTPIPTSCQP